MAKDTRLGIRLDVDLRDALEHIVAEDPELTLASVVRRALREFVQSHRAEVN